jgi:hypothetical protein
VAIQLLGTNNDHALTALVWNGVATAAADVADINQIILDDQNARHPLAQTSGCGGFVKEGVLYVPNRGALTLFPGDVVALDATSGQIILVSAQSIQFGAWVLT